MRKRFIWNGRQFFRFLSKSMTEQTKMLLNFAALVIMGGAFLYRVLGIYEMEFTKAIVFIFNTVMLFLGFLVSCWLFGKIIESIRRNS
jgi:hypothetical protein